MKIFCDSKNKSLAKGKKLMTDFNF